MTRLLALALFALAVLAPSAAANPAPPPDFKNYGGTSRSGPFRSCGSGAGLALAGVGTVWGLMWVSRRRADRRNEDARS